ncbi:hypothetical protein K438DRAFT_1989084 [Mycena galopus ATCC 62051]|nr:hypothetical protein K438DRAFT_1989084 [Mycena galopus ATCC 62051]
MRILGNSLLRKIVLAIPKAMLYSCAFSAFTDVLREGHKEELKRWDAEVQAWEQDHEQPCPYDYSEDKEPTIYNVCLLIAQEEHA